MTVGVRSENLNGLKRYVSKTNSVDKNCVLCIEPSHTEHVLAEVV